MKPTYAAMTREARAVLEHMAVSLERVIAKGQPVSVGDETLACVTLLAASQILAQLDSSAMADEVVERLRVAIDDLEQIAPEGQTWTN